MRRRAFRPLAAFLGGAVSAALLWLPAPAAAQEEPAASPQDQVEIKLPRRRPDNAPQHVQMGSIGELSADDTIDSELHGARKGEPGEWPASFYAVIGSETCTSALIGRQVVLTAAHCIRTGGTIAFTLNKIPYSGTCKRHPKYNLDTNPTVDFALCLVKVPVPSVEMERLGLDPALLNGSPRPEILLTGFGCTSQDSKKLDLIYRIGEAQVISGPYPPNNHLVQVKGGAVLCFGDSGGPGFLLRPGKPRLLVTVNSMVADLGPDTDISFVSSPSPSLTQKFLKDWQAEVRKQYPGVDVAICGLDDSAKGCRQ